MADELPQQTPPQTEPAPEPLPFLPVNLGEHVQSSMKRKAVLATAVVTLLAAGGIIADPLNLFDFGVSRQQAAEPSVMVKRTPLGTPVSISAVCQGVSSPVIRVNWRPLVHARVNALERSENSGSFAPIYYEDSTPPFANASFTDRDIQKGIEYRYRAFGAQATDPIATVTCN